MWSKISSYDASKFNCSKHVLQFCPNWSLREHSKIQRWFRVISGRNPTSFKSIFMSLYQSEITDICHAFDTMDYICQMNFDNMDHVWRYSVVLTDRWQNKIWSLLSDHTNMNEWIIWLKIVLSTCQAWLLQGLYNNQTTSHNCCFRLNGLNILKSAMSQTCAATAIWILFTSDYDGL